MAFNIISAPFLLPSALVTTYLTQTLILGATCQINNALSCLYQTVHLLTTSLTLKPARARKLALMRMPLYKPSWYMHG